MTIRHVVAYRWHDHVDADLVRQIAEAHDRLAARLGSRIDGPVGFFHGSDLGISEGSFDYHVVAEFRTVDDWRVFRDHPDRLLLEAELLDGAVAEWSGGQFAIGAPSSDVDTAISDDEMMAAARRLAAERTAAFLAEPDVEH